ncbi:MAG: hypothetical protein OXC00_16315 [Acidimicrobiaceae bacterium]|nr:hypothetical protein [Acidimicrobiaceae bacterium]
MSPVRPAARDGRSAVGRIQAMLYRRRWLRWAAAGGASVAVLVALSSNAPEPAPEPLEVTSPGPAGLLPSGTRGVPVPVDSPVFGAGDSVDVHAVLDGAMVVGGALVVDAGEDEVVVAVPAEHVDATVDALTTGGVVLVLVPSAQSGGD